MIQDIKVEGGILGCYKDRMVKEKRDALVGAMTTNAAKKRLEEIAEDKDRALSYIANALLMRGLAAFERDGLLNEPASAAGLGHPGDSIRVQTHTHGAKGAGKKRRA